MKRFTKYRVFALLGATVLSALVFWFMLPAVNPVDPNFWAFLLVVAGGGVGPPGVLRGPKTHLGGCV